MPFILDASTTAAWCFPDEDDSAADIALDRLSAEPAIVPALWWVENRNILIIGERRRRIDAVETARFLADLDRLPIRIDNDPINDVLLTLHGATRSPHTARCISNSPSATPRPLPRWTNDSPRPHAMPAWQ